MAEPKKHHYRPELYLKGFSTKGSKKSKQVHVFDKSTNKMFRTSITNLCTKSYFFSSRVEHSLAERIERQVEPILTGLRNEKTLASISPQNFSFLIKWIAWLFIAHPLNKDLLNSILQKHLGIPSLKFTKSTLEQFFFDTHKKILPYFFRRGWVLYFSNEKSFVTSDRTISLAGKTLWGPVGLENAQFIFFPISPHLLLAGGLGNGEGFASKPQKSTKTIIDQANMTAHIKAERFVISQSGKGLLCYLIDKPALPEVTLENQMIKIVMR